MGTPESVVTIKDLWDEQRRQSDRLADAISGLDQTVARLAGHLDAINTRNLAADRIDGDHENRLRSLERWRYALPVSALAAIASAAVAIVAALHALG